MRYFNLFKLWYICVCYVPFSWAWKQEECWNVRDCFIVSRNASPGQLNYNQDLGGEGEAVQKCGFLLYLSLAWIPECKPANFFNSRRVGCQIVFVLYVVFSQGMGSPGSAQCTIQALRGRRSFIKVRCFVLYFCRPWMGVFLSADKFFVWDSDLVIVLCFFLSFFCWLLFCAFFLASFLFFFLVLRGVVSSFLDFVWGVTYCSIKGLVSRVFARYYYKIFFKHTSIENKEVNTTYKALLL